MTSSDVGSGGADGFRLAIRFDGFAWTERLLNKTQAENEKSTGTKKPMIF